MTSSPLSRPPRARSDFKIAIICALPVEAGAAWSILDERHLDSYGKTAGDTNAYMTGVIANHNVVLTLMPGMGKGAAAAVAANLRSSYPRIQLALILGVCGGVPKTPDEQEILLGDVVISEGLVQYDFGRQYPNGLFVRRDTSMENLRRPDPGIRSFVAKLKAQMTSGDTLRSRISQHLTALGEGFGQNVDSTRSMQDDKLFAATYHHQHRDPRDCEICASGRVCDCAQKSSCEELGCDESALVPRQRLLRGLTGPDNQMQQPPQIHFGLIASGDTLMRSGEERDMIAVRDRVIAFEMEGAGAWDILPCMLIKGVSDYADSHKSKEWQGYASAAAAACLKAFLEQWTAEDITEGQEIETIDCPSECSVGGIGIAGDAELSVVASTLTNEGGITLRQKRRARANKRKGMGRHQPPQRPLSTNHSVAIGRNVTSSVVANTLTNVGGINL